MVRSFRSDAAWWWAFATQWNGRFLLTTTGDQSVELTSDTSGNWGCGAWCELKWFQMQWHKRFLNCNKRAGSNYYCSSYLGKDWIGHRVIARCDNESIMTVLNSRYSKEPYVMSMQRTLLFIEAPLQFSISSQHIAGLSNTLTDYLSRNQLKKIYAESPSAHRHSSPVASSLLQWLVDPNMDRKSHHWMERFNTFVRKE